MGRWAFLKVVLKGQTRVLRGCTCASAIRPPLTAEPSTAGSGDPEPEGKLTDARGLHLHRDPEAAGGAQTGESSSKEMDPR